jgi:hypothetical protein
LKALIAMTKEAVRHRLSMAAFYGSEPLWEAVVELMSSGLGIDQQCCAGHAEALRRVDQPSRLSWELSARLWGMVRCVEPYVSPGNTRGILATSGDVLKTLAFACPACRSGGSSAVVHRETGLSSTGSCSVLRQHMDAGAVVLIVSANDPSQQVASSHVLLRNSPYGVQTFEFTEPPAR